MDLRIYMKSGNQHYVDISGFDRQEVMEKFTDSINRGDIYTIVGIESIFTIDCKEVECYEVITNITDEAIQLLRE